MVSTIKSNIVNEARIGLTKNGVYFLAPWNASPLGQQGTLPSLDGNAYILALPTVGTTPLTSPLGTSTAEDPQGRTSPVYEARDRITWLRGRHTFKAGIDRRYTSANSYVSFDAVPRVTLGVAASTGTQNITTISGIGANGTAAGSLLALLAGSVASENQYFYATAGANPVYLPGQNAQHTWKEREWGTFFQDDFKARSNLTLSFGLRWDYYGTPYAATGNMGGVAGWIEYHFRDIGQHLGRSVQSRDVQHQQPHATGVHRQELDRIRTSTPGIPTTRISPRLSVSHGRCHGSARTRPFSARDTG